MSRAPDSFRVSAAIFCLFMASVALVAWLIWSAVQWHGDPDQDRIEEVHAR